MNITVDKTDEIIGVAVSGGMDSMALLYCYCQIKQNIVVINIEHGIRGDSSLHDTEFVRNYCLLGNIPYLSFSVDTLNSTLPGESVETCARRLRYAVFDKLLSDKKVNKIALAHHSDDNAETVLMRIFRGTGIHGLTGITDRQGYIRPLIRYTRDDIEKFVTERSIPYVTDETNLSVDYTRNYIRNSVLPLIKLKYPNVLNSISRLCESAEEIDAYLETLKLPAEKITDGYRINHFFGHPIVIQKYTIMGIIKQLGFLQDFETRHLEAVCSLSDKPNNTSIDLPFNLIATKFDDDVSIEAKHDYSFAPLAFDKAMDFTYCGYRYRFFDADKIVIGISIDPDALPQNCVIRTRNDGDVFKRVNGKTKLLSDFLNDKKLTKTEKNKLLVLAKNNEVFAVLGLETADAVKVTSTTKKILHIKRELIL